MILLLVASMFLMVVFPVGTYAQQPKKDNAALDQNISIYAENEPLKDVVAKICKYLKIDYKYNSQMIADKKISINVSNKPIKFVLD